MSEKELYVLKYVNEQIKGNHDIDYICDVEGEHMMKEIAFYVEKLISKGYIQSKGEWEVINGIVESVYQNNVFSIHYEYLKLSEKGLSEVNK